ncbi:hypothetical protein N9D31_01300 [Oligoflexaceae bacterium]|nr:hypothetical protein [Oligoflexaceae bacterium]
MSFKLISVQKLLFVSLISMLGSLSTSCKTIDSANSELAGNPKKSVPAEPTPDPNTCHSHLSSLEKIKFGYENEDALSEERTLCLSSTIKGISEKTARLLLDNHDLSIAPTTWSEFERQMKNFSKKDDYSQIFQNTVENEENRVSNQAIFSKWGNQSDRTNRFEVGDVVYDIYGYRGKVAGVFASGKVMFLQDGKFKGSDYYASKIAVTYGCAQKDKFCVNETVYNVYGEKGTIVAVFETGKVMFLKQGATKAEDYSLSKITLGY